MKNTQFPRVLVVDDEKGNLNAVRRIFLDEELDLEFAESGELALASVESFQPNVVLLDILMPGIDGYEVCRKIKEHEKTTGIMILLLSGKNKLDDRLAGYEAGADDFIAKPYEPDELIAKVRILLRLKDAQDQLRSINRNLESLVEQRTRELMKKERQAMTGLLVHGIVHNLNNPFSVAMSFADFADREIEQALEDRGRDEQKTVLESARKNLQSVMKAHARMNTIIDDLLRKGGREASDKRRKINLNDLITTELRFLEADMFIKHKLTKKLDLASDLPEFIGVYSDFSQVCCNLIKNASEAMWQSPRKELILRTRYDAEHIYLEFEDTGCGIIYDKIDRIFEPFFTTKPEKGKERDGEPTGSGLGLYTCKELLKGYRGDIQVKTSSAGTSFMITLPLSC